MSQYSLNFDSHWQQYELSCGVKHRQADFSLSFNFGGILVPGFRPRRFGVDISVLGVLGWVDSILKGSGVDVLRFLGE